MTVEMQQHRGRKVSRTLQAIVMLFLLGSVIANPKEGRADGDEGGLCPSNVPGDITCNTCSVPGTYSLSGGADLVSGGWTGGTYEAVFMDGGGAFYRMTSTFTFTDCVNAAIGNYNAISPTATVDMISQPWQVVSVWGRSQLLGRQAPRNDVLTTPTVTVHSAAVVFHA